jgi:hypothetical protein
LLLAYGTRGQGGGPHTSWRFPFPFPFPSPSSNSSSSPFHPSIIVPSPLQRLYPGSSLLRTNPSHYRGIRTPNPNLNYIFVKVVSRSVSVPRLQPHSVFLPSHQSSQFPSPFHVPPLTKSPPIQIQPLRPASQHHQHSSSTSSAQQSGIRSVPKSSHTMQKKLENATNGIA